MKTEWLEIDICGYYSLVKIAFVPICVCKNDQQNDVTMPVPRIHVTSLIEL